MQVLDQPEDRRIARQRVEALEPSCKELVALLRLAPGRLDWSDDGGESLLDHGRACLGYPVGNQPEGDDPRLGDAADELADGLERRQQIGAQARP